MMLLPKIKGNNKKPQKNAAKYNDRDIRLMPFHDFVNFDSVKTLAKAVLICDRIDVLRDFYKNSIGCEFEYPSDVERSPDLDLGYTRNMVFLISVVGYCKTMHPDVAVAEKLSELDNYYSWIADLEYGDDGPVFTKEGRFKNALPPGRPNKIAKKRMGPEEIQKKSKPRREEDEISAELDNAGAEYKNLMKVVKSYDVDTTPFQKYEKLNAGLLRMNLENKLRKLLKEKKAK